MCYYIIHEYPNVCFWCSLSGEWILRAAMAGSEVCIWSAFVDYVYSKGLYQCALLSAIWVPLYDHHTWDFLHYFTSSGRWCMYAIPYVLVAS